MPKRIEQVNELFRRAAAEFILTELNAPKDIMITATKVAVSNDLKSLKIYVSIFPENHRGTGFEILKKNVKGLKEYLSKNVFLRAMPHISYEIDAREDAADEVEKLLREIEGEK